VLPELENLIKKRTDNLEFFTMVRQLNNAVNRLIDLKQISNQCDSFYEDAKA
jgi:hypothetical protein